MCPAELCVRGVWGRGRSIRTEITGRHPYAHKIRIFNLLAQDLFYINVNGYLYSIRGRNTATFVFSSLFSRDQISMKWIAPFGANSFL